MDGQAARNVVSMTIKSIILANGVLWDGIYPEQQHLVYINKCSTSNMMLIINGTFQLQENTQLVKTVPLLERDV